MLGSVKRATRLGESAPQIPPVTPDTMKSAFFLATEGLDDGEADHPITTLMVERLVVFVIMVFSWCTMLRPDNLLGLCCRDVSLAPNDDGGNWAFMQQHGHPRWVRVRYSQLKTNVLGTRQPRPNTFDLPWLPTPKCGHQLSPTLSAFSTAASGPGAIFLSSPNVTSGCRVRLPGSL